MENPETSPYRVDRSDVVVNRNRYGNVQPWDASRIKLKKPIAGSDYVNASPIILKSRNPTESASLSSETPSGRTTKYIATQGPKQGQESHFWHMVHQETVGDTAVIVMLTQLVESNKEKCAQYYPTELSNPVMILQHEDSSTSVNASVDNGSDPFLDYDQITGTDDRKGPKAAKSFEESQASVPEQSSADTITLLSKDYDSSVECEVRRLKLTISGESKTVIHYLFGRWSDFGKPDPNDQKALIELSRRTLTEAGDSPRVVHCSAGVGRTGTWIALDFLVREVEEDRLLDSVKSGTSAKTMTEATVPASGGGGSSSTLETSETWGKSGPPKINTPTREDGFDKDEHDLIFETVNTLREQRMMMVIRELQFSFLYDVVREALFEKYHAKAEGATVTDGALAVAEDSEGLPRQSKIPKREDGADGEGEEEGVSEAETEIMDVDAEQKVEVHSSDDEDPYRAVSPDIVRQGFEEKI